MKADIVDFDGKKIRTIDLPTQFAEEYRPDLIRRAYLALMSHNRQPYGAFEFAGKRASAELSRRRRHYKTSYGHGISRVPRKTVWRRGRQFGWIGAFAPGTVGGRRAHPPKSGKNFYQKINVKERRKAIRSALSATFIPEIVKQRGHIFTFLPNIIDNKIEDLKKTRDVVSLMEKLKLDKEVERISLRKIRSGKGKMRGRKYKGKKGPLFVVSSSNSPLLKAASNIPGVDVCVVNSLNVGLLAPGGFPGRLTIFSEKAIDTIKNNGLFLNETKMQIKKDDSKKQEKKEEKKPEIKKQEIKKKKRE